MKVLITGGSGFLGINLVRSFLKKGINDITTLDVADFDYPERNKIEEVKGDIRNKDALLRNYHWYLDNLKSFEGKAGVSRRVPWNQGVLKMLKVFF